MELSPFTTKPIKGVAPSGSDNPIRSIFEELYTENNINYSDGSVIIKGTGNTIGQNVRGYVIGNDQVIEEDGYWINGKNIDDGSVFYESIDYTSIEIGADYTIDPDAQAVVYLTASGITVTLPDADPYTDSKIYIKNKSTGNCDVTVAAGDIDGNTVVTLAPLDSLTLHAKGGVWNIL